MDPKNPVVLLCVEGMRLEGDGRFEEARDLFSQAWDESRDDFEACIAAHYLARHQASAEETLRWNQESLKRARAVGDERVESFYPSLYLNLGHSYEQLGETEEAARWYELAAESAGQLPEDRYGGIVKGGIEVGRRRTSPTYQKCRGDCMDS